MKFKIHDAYLQAHNRGREAITPSNLFGVVEVWITDIIQDPDYKKLGTEPDPAFCKFILDYQLSNTSGKLEIVDDEESAPIKQFVANSATLFKTILEASELQDEWDKYVKEYLT